MSTISRNAIPKHPLPIDMVLISHSFLTGVQRPRTQWKCTAWQRYSLVRFMELAAHTQMYLLRFSLQYFGHVCCGGGHDRHSAQGLQSRVSYPLRYSSFLRHYISNLPIGQRGIAAEFSMKSFQQASKIPITMV